MNWDCFYVGFCVGFILSPLVLHLAYEFGWWLGKTFSTKGGA